MGWARGRVSGILLQARRGLCRVAGLCAMESCTGSDTPWADGPAMLSYLFLNCCIY